MSTCIRKYFYLKLNSTKGIYKKKFKIHGPLTNLGHLKKHKPPPKKVETKKKCQPPSPNILIKGLLF
jgi:hypothetical protein